MALEGLYEIMKGHATGTRDLHILDGMPNGKNYFTLVTKEFFQSNPNCIGKDDATDDVLAFTSLVLSYAKAVSDDLKADKSPKLRTAFMPRTDFNTSNKSSQSFLTNNKGQVSIDTALCSGKASEPKPNNKFGGLGFKNPAAIPHATMKIKSWIEGIGKSSGSTDMLSTFDKPIDGSIGGIGTKMESMLCAKRQVPLFEFQGLNTVQTNQLESWTNKVDATIQDIHKKHKDAP